MSSPELKFSLDNITDISLVSPREYAIDKQLKDSGGSKKSVRIEISAPARIKLILNQVDQDLFRNLTQLLGNNYFDRFKSLNHLKTNVPLASDQLTALGRELLPTIEHNPIIEFNLRPNVQFHDGHVLDANDVKFTYEAILNPKNLSPRIADYEPVKNVEVIDPHTVRIVYKRLYSPAVSTWAMATGLGMYGRGVDGT